jgi:hypothetical protein
MTGIRCNIAVLNCIYEEAFLGFSYWVPSEARSAQCAECVSRRNTTRRVNFIFDADVGFFFSIRSVKWLGFPKEEGTMQSNPRPHLSTKPGRTIINGLRLRQRWLQLMRCR